MTEGDLGAGLLLSARLAHTRSLSVRFVCVWLTRALLSPRSAEQSGRGGGDETAGQKPPDDCQTGAGASSSLSLRRQRSGSSAQPQQGPAKQIAFKASPAYKGAQERG